MYKTTVYFDEELRKRIKRDAKLGGVSEAEVIRSVLYEHTKPIEDEPLWPESFGIGDSGRIPAEKLDEWKVKNWNPDW